MVSHHLVSEVFLRKEALWPEIHFGVVEAEEDTMNRPVTEILEENQSGTYLRPDISKKIFKGH